MAIGTNAGRPRPTSPDLATRRIDEHRSWIKAHQDAQYAGVFEAQTILCWRASWMNFLLTTGQRSIIATLAERGQEMAGLVERAD